MSDSEITVQALLTTAHREAVAVALRRAGAERVQQRVRECDATLWGPEGTPEIANRLGWLTIAPRMLGDIDDLAGLADELTRQQIEDVVLLGMGGSSLAPEVLRGTFEGDEGGVPQRADSQGSRGLHVLDSTNAGAVRAVGDAIEPQRTLFLVSSKSGGTIEPLSMLEHFWQEIPDGSHFAAITDPGSGLERLARERGFRRIFHGDPEIGGRYSALSPFGIVPAALIGVDVARLLEGAASAWDTTIAEELHRAEGADAGEPRAALPAWLWLGAALGSLAKLGRNKLTFTVAPSLDGLGLWLEQLVAESTGKHGRGILPVAQEPLLGPESYGEDRVFVHIAELGAPEPETERALAELAAAGHPTITIPTRGPYDLGRIFMLAELCVAVAGWELAINPFDQPNVQEAKDATSRVLAELEQQGHAPQPPADASPQQLLELLGGASPPDYVALMGYVQPSPAFDAAIAELRRTLMQARRVTTTFGYGPRFLHSTGQFHKGGPPTGRFLQLLHDTPPDVEIPGKPYSFTQLEHAQADGDLQTLRAHQLPAQRVTLAGTDAAAALRALAAEIAGML
ncbi:MAG TPA: hypothetical protein VGF95_04555 [Solirubrobacteraceae bacterium]